MTALVVPVVVALACVMLAAAWLLIGDGTQPLPGPVVHPLSREQVRPAGEVWLPGATTYQQVYAAATAINDAWLDRLFWQVAA